MVIDTSVLINLLALEPEHLASVCSALGSPLHVAPQVRAEARRDPRNGQPAEARLNDLFGAGALKLVELDAGELETFVELVSADAPDDLDDGEAATIAVAVHRSMVAVVDEAKGLRIARLRSVQCISTLAILLGKDARRALGQKLPDALEAALSYARMRVPASERTAVVEMLGRERAAKYPKLGVSARPRSRRESK